MDRLKNYDVIFVGLKNGVHHYKLEINKEFFDLFEFDEEFEDPKLNITFILEKKDTMLGFDFEITGDVTFNCDVTGLPFQYQVFNNFKRIVKFGDDYLDEGEDVVIFPHSEHTINIAHWVYENFLLNLPTKRVHPKVLRGELKTEESSKLEELQPTEKDHIEDDEEIDPRWNKLKDLL